MRIESTASSKGCCAFFVLLINVWKSCEKVLLAKSEVFIYNLFKDGVTILIQERGWSQVYKSLSGSKRTG